MEGRQPIMNVNEVQTSIKKKLQERLHDSNTFKLKHMKDMFVEKKKEVAAAGGLDPDTIKVSVSSQWAKVRMVVTAAEGDLSFSTKKLITKTAARYRSEHFVISRYSYALTPPL